MATPPSSFISTANEHLTRLQHAYGHALCTNDHAALRRTTAHARAIRHAALIHSAAIDILSLPPSDHTNQSRHYLSYTLPRLHTALRDDDVDTLSSITDSIYLVLDNMVLDIPATFTPIPNNPNNSVANLDPTLTSPKSIPDNSKPQAPATPRPKRTSFFSTVTALTKRQKLILFLYLFVVVAAIAAVAIITVRYVGELVNPSGFIQSTRNTSLLAPVVTVCLSQPGIPFSRLQLFNFTDASGMTFVGADPSGAQDERASPEFSQVVDRFWDNPDGEDCNGKVGDFFPFPLQSLIRITSGQISTRCRQCYRVGLKRDAFALSTAFQNSSVLSMYTDNYFLQCMRTDGGLNEESMTFIHDQLFDKRVEMSKLDVLSTQPGIGLTGAELSRGVFQKVTSEQACNIFYFSFFPKALNRIDPTVDIRYQYDGESWNAIGSGPYFRVRNDSSELLPAESLQMYVEGRSSARGGSVQNDTDMILIGPNTQTYATFRRVIVFGRERYDISSSTSNLFQSDITPIFGYWLVYRIYYNFNRFVTDEWYRDSTYSTGQWVVDVLGYLSLFTGISIFSLFLLPILRAMRRRDKLRLLQNRPEGYVWTKHKRAMACEVGVGQMGSGRSESNDLEVAGGSLLLPGYNA